LSKTLWPWQNSV